MGATMDRFLFSSEANVGTSVNDGGSRTVGNREPFSTEPQMLNRFLGGLLHPIIHTGYGAEFGIPGMIVEGSYARLWGYLNSDADSDWDGRTRTSGRDSNH